MTTKYKQSSFVLYAENYDWRNNDKYVELKQCTWRQALKKAQKIFPNTGFSIKKSITQYDMDGEIEQIRPSPYYSTRIGRPGNASDREYILTEREV